jgi:hypothetical protein
MALTWRKAMFRQRKSTLEAEIDGGQSEGRVEVTNYALDGKKRRRNSLLHIFSVRMGFEATAKRPNRTSSSRWTNMSGED